MNVNQRLEYINTVTELIQHSNNINNPANPIIIPATSQQNLNNQIIISNERPTINITNIEPPVRQFPNEIYIERPEICGNKIPIVSREIALIVLILNITWAGLGTMVLECMLDESEKKSCFWLMIGITQLLLGVVCVGYIWGFVLGCQLVNLSAYYRE